METPAPTVLLSDMTWPEARAAISAAKVAIIPVGSTEQHGPGMTLSTDIALASAVAIRLAEAISPRAIVTPSLPFGLSTHHMSFPGTITLSAATFGSVLKEVMRSLRAHGIDKFFLLNGHGGNQAALTVISNEASHELEVQVATAIYLAAASDFLKETFGRTYAHACEIESSVALALVPTLVRHDAFAKGEELPAAYRHTALSGGGSPVGTFVTTTLPFEKITRNGNLGDPANGTAEIGESIIDLAVTRLAEFLEDFIADETSAK